MLVSELPLDDLDNVIHKQVLRYFHGWDVDDMKQASMAKLIERLPKYDPKKSRITSHAANIARCLCIDELRRRKTRAHDHYALSLEDLLTEDDEHSVPDWCPSCDGV